MVSTLSFVVHAYADSFLFIESLRQAVIAADKAVANMVGGLSFPDSAVQASTAQALGMLACDQLVRQQVGQDRCTRVKSAIHGHAGIT